jgi:hypothetical protein
MIFLCPANSASRKKSATSPVSYSCFLARRSLTFVRHFPVGEMTIINLKSLH